MALVSRQVGRRQQPLEQLQAVLVSRQVGRQQPLLLQAAVVSQQEGQQHRRPQWPALLGAVTREAIALELALELALEPVLVLVLAPELALALEPVLLAWVQWGLNQPHALVEAPVAL